MDTSATQTGQCGPQVSPPQGELPPRRRIYGDRRKCAYFTAIKAGGEYYVPCLTSLLPENRKICLASLRGSDGVQGLGKWGRHFQFTHQDDAKAFMVKYLAKKFKVSEAEAGRMRFFLFQWRKSPDGEFVPKLVEVVNRENVPLIKLPDHKRAKRIIWP